MDYWIVQVKPDGSIYRFDLSSGSFTPSATLGELMPTFQDQLRYFDETALLMLSPEPGNHTFYFGIDTRQDGELSPAELYFDTLELSVGNLLQ